MGGQDWEMWHFAWENGSLVFKPNSMPKSYAAMIRPIAGALITLAAAGAIIEDAVRYRRGTFEVAGGSGSGEE